VGRHATDGWQHAIHDVAPRHVLFPFFNCSIVKILKSALTDVAVGICPAATYGLLNLWMIGYMVDWKRSPRMERLRYEQVLMPETDSEL
jgi:hypothetical protein